MKKILFLILSGLILLGGNAMAQQPVVQTLQYDNNTHATDIGGDNGLFLWAVKFEAGQIAAYRTIDTVHLYGPSSPTAAEFYVIQGPTPYAGTLLYRQNVSVTAVTWNHYALSTPATLDATKPLWVIFKARHAATVGVASACVGTTINAGYYSEDSTGWKNIVQDDHASWNWMIRASVSAPGAAPSYTLTVDCDTTLGRVVGSGSYTAGDTAVMTAFPKPGCLFLYWNDGNTANPRRVVMDANKSFRAEFVRDDDQTQYTVTVTCDPNRGTVTGGGTYTSGQSITLTATPFAGYTFRNWSDGNADNPRTLVVTQNITLRATFVDGNGDDGGGNGGGNNGISEASQAMPVVTVDGRQLTITMQQSTDYSIVDLQGRTLHSAQGATGTQRLSFDHPGVYLLRLSGLPTRKIYVR
ncbi:MAG: InlB B-repeat-containing protein [Bacteroidales bacterium]|nr:InlB B-repeat-containing protein [Bacteroidales bacterium]